MNPIKVAGLVAASLVFVGWGASNYVSPEFLAVAPDGASVYVTAATGELGELFGESARLEKLIRKNLGAIGYEV